MNELTLVIFGITSNLAHIKLIPSLFTLSKQHLLPPDASIIGVSRSVRDHSEFLKTIATSLKSNDADFDEDSHDFTEFSKRLSYLSGDISSSEFYKKLRTLLAEKQHAGEIIFYFAISPELYQPVLDQLQQSGFSKKTNRVKVVLEKPLGIDLESARSLNDLLLKHLDEKQIYRVDHYLGKETVQNILSFRFGNGLFEPLINSEHIDHIQITAAEQFGINARSYYDNVGALKDVGQNHLLQLLTFATMDAPSSYTNEAVTAARVRLLKQLDARSTTLVLGQYNGYKYESGSSPTSSTDTFFAMKTTIKNDRFSGVPIYIRAGKHLAQSVTEISIVFKVPQNRLFKHIDLGGQPNVLTYRIQPNEGLHLQTLIKRPGHELGLELNQLQFCYETLGHTLLEPYEHILYDAIQGNQTFFNDAEEVEAQWGFIDAITKNRPEVETYEKSSWGPKSSHTLIEVDGRSWLTPRESFCTPNKS